MEKLNIIMKILAFVGVSLILTSFVICFIGALFNINNILYLNIFRMMITSGLLICLIDLIIFIYSILFINNN